MVTDMASTANLCLSSSCRSSLSAVPWSPEDRAFAAAAVVFSVETCAGVFFSVPPPAFASASRLAARRLRRTGR